MKPAVDHVVLPTADLAVARARLSALGFTVAPDGVHPFGTLNCCVYLPGGVFLEPLAVADPAEAAAAAAVGNVFVGRDRQFRAASGDEGMSALVLATDDAEGDHRQLVARGLSAGDLLTFSRPFVDASGRSDQATFRLAFGAAQAAAPGYFFACQRIGVPAVDRSALERHDNGAMALTGLWLAGPEGRAMRAAIAAALGQGGALDLDGVAVAMLDDRFGLGPDGAGRPFAALSFAVRDVAALRRLLAARAIAHHLSGRHVVVPSAPGQGVAFIFEDHP